MIEKATDDLSLSLVQTLRFIDKFHKLQTEVLHMLWILEAQALS